MEAGDVIRSGCLLKAHGWKVGQRGLEKERIRVGVMELGPGLWAKARQAPGQGRW